MKLLLDLGNTRLKWLVVDGATPLATGATAWTAPFITELQEAWAAWPGTRQVIAASVVDDAREQAIAALVSRRFGVAVDWVRSPAAGAGVRSAYAEPQRLGVDRFLTMVAAHADGLGACVLVGVGTALTLDALAADGRHLGGLIAPGPHLMRQSLASATARVRTELPGHISAWADNTADAVASGCWGACAGLVERFVRQVAEPLGSTPLVLVGGGDAAILRELLPMPTRLYVDGVLRGLATWSGAPIPAAASH
ncbi:type III pantothenate kinase [Dyella sp.]|jgi:type III pantothenate kinase|uniref:type III pantothenate kinase n=1 Tax=Dyella sp. TaxID=1869338 RepID=UPI002D7660DA|nr:type III pantothenate kinase [Dyella sp.]HET6432989.1 type III pantothenate kinase [Dyella sp.]